MNALRRSLTLLATMAVSVSLLGAAGAPATAAVGDDVIAWVEVEDGAISGGPGFNSGDHSNFSGTGSYTFRETGMQSTMSVTAPAAGVYPVWVRYAAGPLGADENVTRSMGLLTNGGARQLMSLPMTSFENWEAWRFVRYDVTLAQGANTVAIQCNRGTDFCRLNFDAIQVGGTAPDPCVGTATDPGYTRMFDGTLDSFDGWRKAGAGGFGRQTGCFIRSFGGRGAEWFTQQQTAPYTLELDWRRTAADDESSLYLASSGRGGADPVGGFTIPIGTGTGAVVPTGGTAQAAIPTAVTSALKPVGAWNTYRVQVTGSRIKVYLNDTLVNTYNSPVAIPAVGYVGLENRGATHDVSFRDIQVRPDVDLGQLAGPFSRARLADGTTVNPGGESTLGNLVAEVQRGATRSPATGSAQLALVSPTALGADLRGNAGGYPATVTYQQAALVQPSSDPLVNLQLTGAQLKTVLEQQWQRTAAGAAVPARPFLRLGTSAGFTSTYDPTRAEGARITGMWLNGAAIVPTTSYSVTVSSSLAAGGDNFHGLAAGTARLDTGKGSAAALVDYLGRFADTSAGAGPLAVEPAQHAVGVAFPGGARASYPAGDVLGVDLSSWSFSTATDPQDTAVQVSLGGQSIGTFPVDGAVGTEAYDEQGRVAVRAIIPATTPAGPATVRIVGTTTGTAVELPIAVTVKAASTTTLTATPTTLVVDQGAASVSATVAEADGTPTGEVEFLLDGDVVSTVALVDGQASASVGPFATAGTRSVTARYLGSATTAPSTSAPASVVVEAAPAPTTPTPTTPTTPAPVTPEKVRSTVTAKVRPSKVQAGTTRAKLAIGVTAAGVTPTGQVTVKVGTKTYTGTLAGGRVTIVLARFAKPGPVRVTVTYLGDALTATAATTARITVTKGRRK